MSADVSAGPSGIEAELDTAFSNVRGFTAMVKNNLCWLEAELDRLMLDQPESAKELANIRDRAKQAIRLLTQLTTLR